MTAPLFMQWAAAEASAPRSLASESFTYCDLGCGDGIPLNVLAAEYPAASFVGIDRDPVRLGLARSLAVRAGLTNVTFRQAGLADLSGAGLPPMDFIAARGAYSGVDERGGDDLRVFIRSQLAPGGLLCLEYSSLPGSAVRDPLFHYLRLIADRIPGDSVHRFASAFGELTKLRPHATFFRSAPAAGAALEGLGDRKPGLLAHEAMIRGAHSFYCHEVHDAMAEIGLAYRGSGELKLNHPELLMSREAFERFDEVTRGGDRQRRLAAQDLILNTASRADVFRRSDPAPVAEARPSRLRGVETLHLRRSGAGDSLDARRRASASIAVDLASSLHSAVLDAVGGGGRTIAETVAAPALEAQDRAAVDKALAELVMMRALNATILPARQIEYRADRRYRLASRLNAIILDETIRAPQAIAFASPVLGAPVMIPLEVRRQLSAWLGGAASPQFTASVVPELLRFGLLEET